MSSRLTIAAMVLSCLIGLSILLLWARSYFYADSINYEFQHVPVDIGANSQQGGLEISFATFTDVPQLRAGLQSQWIAIPVYDGWNDLTLRPMYVFRARNYLRHIGGSVHIFIWVVVFPLWVPIFFVSLFPAWLVFRSRGNKGSWTLRSEVTWNNPRLRARIARFVILSAVGCVVGALVARLDVALPIAHYGWRRFIALWALLPVVTLMAVYTRRRIRWHRAILWMALELAGCFCFFQAASERVWTHYHIYLFDIGDLLELVVMTGMVCFVFGAILLLFLQVKPEKPKPGPYCPECGYCLIGLPKQICSECGRPFTLDELGIEADVLIPGNAHPT